MGLVFKYFFFLAALIGVINSAVQKSKLSQFIKNTPNNSEESGKILKGYTLSLTVPFLLLGIIQLAGGYTSPFFVFSLNLSNIFVFLSWLVLICSWGLLFYWIFFKDGAKILVRYNMINGTKTINELTVKIYVVLMILGGIVGLVVGSSMHIGDMVPF